MSFTEAVRTALIDRFMEFEGRSARSEYWWFVLFQFLVNMVFQLLAAGLGSLFATIGFFVGLALLVPAIAVTIRRFHDIEKSGWWTLTLLIPLLNIILILVWFTRKGTDGANRFGPDPLASHEAHNV